MEITTTTDYAGTSGDRLTIPTHVTPQGGQTTHPSVVYVPEGWKGYRYWMAHTPYPGGNDDHEDPNICASNDGVKWVVPEGLTNPLDDANGQPIYNSDVDLTLFRGVMYLFWRKYDPARTGNEEQILLKTSVDGVLWSSTRVAYSSDHKVRRLMSPSMIAHEDGGWTMWAVDIVDPYRNKIVKFRTSQRLPETGSWGQPTVCTVRLPQGRVPWHLSIIENPYGTGWVGLLNDCIAGKSGSGGALFFISSTNSINWVASANHVVPKAIPGVHDASYRACLIPAIVDGVQGFRVYYAAWLLGPPRVWNVWRTFISAMPIRDVFGEVAMPSVSPGSPVTLDIVLPAGHFRDTPHVEISCDSGRLNLAHRVIDQMHVRVTIDNWSPARASAGIIRWRASDRS